MYNTRNQFTQQALLKQAKEVFDKSKSDNNFYKISNPNLKLEVRQYHSKYVMVLLQWKRNIRK